MEVSFRTRGMRDYWLDPTPDALGLGELAVAKRLIEDLVSVDRLDDLLFIYDLERNGNTLQVVSAPVVLTCAIDGSRVTRSDVGGSDFSRITRLKVLSVGKIGGAL